MLYNLLTILRLVRLNIPAMPQEVFVMEIPPTPDPYPYPTPPTPQPTPTDAPLVPSWFYPFALLLLIVGIIAVVVVVYLTYKALTKHAAKKSSVPAISNKSSRAS